MLGFGVEILGCGKSGIPSVVRETKRYREFGLPCKYIVIRNADEWIYCLDIMQGTVVSWDSKNKKSVQVANSFDEYLYMAFSEAKESWEE